MKTDVPRREGDIVIERGEWTYIVRHVRGRESLVSENWWDGTLIGIVGTLLVAVIETVAADTSNYWKVAVLRYRTSRFGRIRVLHKERLPDGEEPEARVNALVEAVNRGDYEGSR